MLDPLLKLSKEFKAAGHSDQILLDTQFKV